MRPVQVQLARRVRVEVVRHRNNHRPFGVGDADVGNEPLTQEPYRLVGHGALAVHLELGAVGGEGRRVRHVEVGRRTSLR